MAQILFSTYDTTLYQRLARGSKKRRWDLEFVEEASPERRVDIVLLDLREAAAFPTPLPAFVQNSLLAVLCTPEQVQIAEEAMVTQEAYVVFQDGADGDVEQILFTLRKALYDDDKHGTALQAARTSAERYEDLLQAIPDIVYRLDVEGNFTFVNEAIESLGYAPDELIGSHFSRLLEEGEIERVSRKQVLPKFRGKTTGEERAPGLFDERRGRTRKTKGMEIKLRPKVEGHSPSRLKGMAIAYGEVSATGYYREERRRRVFTGTVGIIRDVTWRKRGEELLHLTSLALDQSATAVCIFGVDGGIEFANPQFSHMLGLPHDAMARTGMKAIWDEFFPDSDYAEVVRRTRSDGATSEDLRVRTYTGNRVWTVLRTQNVQTGEGREFILLLQDDIEERKQYEDALRRMVDEKSVLIQEVHHRVKNNLQVIASLLSIEADHEGSPQVQNFLATSRRRISTMAMVHDALFQSDAEAHLDLITYLQEVITEVIESVKGRVEIKRNLPEAYSAELSFAIVFGLVVSELVSHFAAAGAAGKRPGAGASAPAASDPAAGGTVEVELTVNGQIELTVRGSRRRVPPEGSAAIRIVEALAGQLGGELRFPEAWEARLTLTSPAQTPPDGPQRLPT